MDPLTALGLAANIIQFISFASDMISKTIEIHSAKGCASQTLSLDSVYRELQGLSSALESSGQGDSSLGVIQDPTGLAKHASAIKALSHLCKEDCDRLLEITKKLKTADGSKNRWQSFRIALKTIWKGNEIANLEEKLHRTQRTLTLQVCAMISDWQVIHTQHLKDLRMESQRLSLQQCEKLEEIARSIDELGTRISKAESGPVKSVFKADDISSLSDQISQLSLSKAAVIKEQVILKSLNFDSRPVRHSSIPEAHQRTFGWVFREPSEHEVSTASDNLLTWLRRGNGFFWISGKPGSGKSTLMKFIACHRSTQRALSSWSYPKPAVIVSHYFWSAGTSMQRCQQGLLQSLLYDIFRQLPHLMESACTDRWAKEVGMLSNEIWLVPELRQALQKIARLARLSVKFCFFIDGLDEFEGDHLDFCLALMELSKSPHVKLCVSSRPWNVFEDSFGQNLSAKLYIHEYTRDDIVNYTESRLQEHPRWNEMELEAKDSNWLIGAITERAAGVFLWVFLVTRQLRQGLTEYDSFSDLRRRLESIPTDLEVFFKQILDSVESFYYEKMATSLQIALAAREPADTVIYSFHDEEYDDKNYASKLPLQAFNEDKLRARRKQISQRLNGRCRGLLEVNPYSKCVEFLHRTVMDFLRTREMSNFLSSKAPPVFNPNLSLLRAFTAYIKSSNFPEEVHRTGFAQCTPSGLMSSLREALAHASELDESVEAYTLLDELERSLPEMNKKGQAKLRVWGIASNPVYLFFREEVIEARLAGYLNHTLPSQPSYFLGLEKPVMACVVSSLFTSSSSSSPRSGNIETLRCLLKHGQDPNETYSDPIYTSQARFVAKRTPWTDFLDIIVPRDLKTFGHQSPEVLNMLEWAIENGLPSLMLKHGADPNAQVYHGSSLCYSTAWIDLLLVSFTIPSQSSYQDLYLQTLDDLITSGANLAAAPTSTCVSGKAGLLDGGSSAHSAFFGILFGISTSRSDRFNTHLLVKVIERLLLMALKVDIKMEGYWPIIEKALTPVVYSQLRNRHLDLGGNTKDQSPCRNSKIQKRKFAGDSGGSGNAKMAKSTFPKLGYEITGYEADTE